MISSRSQLNLHRGPLSPKLRCNRFFGMSLIVGLSMTLIGLGCSSQSTESPPTGEQARVEVGTLQLEIDLPEGDDVSETITCFDDSTVLSILEDAQQLGLLKFTSRGSGETAFLESIQGVENSGSGGGNWVYRVNDQLGDKSSGVFSVAPDDKIQWSYGSVSFDEQESEPDVPGASTVDEENKSSDL